MSTCISPSIHKPYGISRVCRVWQVARSTVYYRPAQTSRRPGPIPTYSDEAIADHIRTLLAQSPFTGEGYRKMWARLHFMGIPVGKERVLRIMREHGLQVHQRPRRKHGPKAHDGTIKTEKVDEMWGTDMTTTMTTQEGTASIFFVVDHCSLECLGIHAARPGTRFEALEPIRQAVKSSFGTFGSKVAKDLKLRHDHGSQYISDTFQGEVRFLGIESSPSFVKEPQGNGIAERFVRILKENLLWVRHFPTVEDLRLALLEFKETYNSQWILGRHGYKTPQQVRQGQLTVSGKAA